MLSISQNFTIFKLILPSERMRTGAWGEVDVSLTHDFQMLILGGPDLMSPLPKGQVVDSDFNEELQYVRKWKISAAKTL